MPDDRTTPAVDQYCGRLRKALRSVPAVERDEIVEEMRVHLLERIGSERDVTQEAVGRVIRAAGDPEELAREYEMQAMLRQAAATRSPWRLLHTTLRWARTGGAGIAAFFVALLGYGCGAVFYLSAFLKPFFPSRFGLWLAPRNTLCFGYWDGRLSGAQLYGVSVRPPSFVLGTLGPVDGPVRELLGIWLIPIGVVCGAILLFVTTLFVRWFVRRYGPRESGGTPRGWVPSVSRTA
jgi:hypothetical protein